MHACAEALYPSVRTGETRSALIVIRAEDHRLVIYSYSLAIYK
jgi:hypothetical protein